MGMSFEQNLPSENRFSIFYADEALIFNFLWDSQEKTRLSFDLVFFCYIINSTYITNFLIFLTPAKQWKHFIFILKELHQLIQGEYILTECTKNFYVNERTVRYLKGLDHEIELKYFDKNGYN
jgi:hypothetical protein